MQHIGLRCETESGEILLQFQAGGVDARLLALAPSNGVCLRFVDPYGDTVFNQLQLPVLIEELEVVEAEASDEDIKQHVAAMIAFLRKAEGVHLYVRFVGD